MSSEEIMDEEIRKLEEELKKLESKDTSIDTSPSPERKDSTLVLFRELIKSPDSRKFSNLGKEEIRYLNSQLNIAHYLDAEGLDEVGNYLRSKTENTLALSMSKKGWFGNLIVTQIKKEQKVNQPQEPKKGLFNFGKSKGEEGQ